MTIDESGKDTDSDVTTFGFGRRTMITISVFPRGNLNFFPGWKNSSSQELRAEIGLR